MTKDNSKNLFKIIVAAVAVFLVLLVVALIYNLVRLSAENKRLDSLKAQAAYYESIIGKNGEFIDYCQTPEFIEQYAREYLDMIYRGETPVGVN
ncbi:MAG: hypothetical protein J1G04_01385 [Clostridiales bacterium]|nr:hypothetical protein [Clostridiales bacterium]